jgi:HSP20 family protein
MANAVERWEPFKEMMSLREAMNRLVEDSFIRPGSWLAPVDAEAMGVAMDVIDTKDNVIVKASVPGIKPEDIDVSVTGEVLTIKGETASEEKIEQGSYLRQERRFGKFERTLTLPTQVQADKADAKFEHGVLTLTLPKAEQVKPKSIKVKTK